MTYIRFSLHPENERHFAVTSTSDDSDSIDQGGVRQPTITQETGKVVPVLDQDNNQVGDGIITDLNIRPGEGPGRQRIEVGMEVTFTDEAARRRITVADLRGLSIQPEDDGRPGLCLPTEAAMTRALMAGRLKWKLLAPTHSGMDHTEGCARAVREAIQTAIQAYVGTEPVEEKAEAGPAKQDGRPILVVLSETPQDFAWWCRSKEFPRDSDDRVVAGARVVRGMRVGSLGKLSGPMFFVRLAGWDERPYRYVAAILALLQQRGAVEIDPDDTKGLAPWISTTNR
jgi:hypothetical protein